MTGPPSDESASSVNNNTITACVYHQKESPIRSARYADMKKDGVYGNGFIIREDVIINLSTWT
jgi:hypothetical protein